MRGVVLEVLSLGESVIIPTETKATSNLHADKNHFEQMMLWPWLVFSYSVLLHQAIQPCCDSKKDCDKCISGSQSTFSLNDALKKKSFARNNKETERTGQTCTIMFVPLQKGNETSRSTGCWKSPRESGSQNPLEKVVNQRRIKEDCTVRMFMH